MESWKAVWNVAASMLPTNGLEHLLKALEDDDPRLRQGATTSPPALICMQGRDVEGACLLGFCGWQGEGLQKVGEVEEFFNKTCFAIGRQLGEPAACGTLLNWFDESPRDEVRQSLIPLVQQELAKRVFENPIVVNVIARN